MTFVIIILVSSLVSISILFFIAPLNFNKLNAVHRFLIKSADKKWNVWMEEIPEDEKVIVSFDILISKLSKFEKRIVEKIFNLDPSILGFKCPFYSLEKPGKIIKLNSVQFKDGEHVRESGVQFCPAHSLSDFKKMQAAIFNDIGKKIFIDSGYRSPGRQAYLFIHYLANENSYSLKENSKWIALPGYSEHGHPVNNAIDISNEMGINGFSDGQNADDFEKLPEYEWLMNNAAEYNYYLSYPNNNIYGVAFEPWHWHWENNND